MKRHTGVLASVVIATLLAASSSAASVAGASIEDQRRMPFRSTPVRSEIHAATHGLVPDLLGKPVCLPQVERSPFMAPLPQIQTDKLRPVRLPQVRLGAYCPAGGS